MSGGCAPADVVVTGVAAVCPVGHDARSTFTSVRAGVCRIGEPADLYFVDGRGARVRPACGAAEGVTDGHRRFLRIYRMAVRAYAEALAHARLTPADGAAMPVFLALAEPSRPGWDARVESLLLRRIHAALGASAPAPELRVFPAGHAASYLALQEAVAAIARGATDRALVGGVDSYLDEFTLQWLADMGRLKLEGRPGGFVPAEGAAFLVLERGRAAGARGAGVFGRVEAVANSFEDNGVYEKRPCLGEGLTQALRAVLQPGKGQPGPGLILCDLNGERHRAGEWALALQRSIGPDADVPLWHAADCMGDAGAASGALNIVLGTLALARGHAGSKVLAWGSSDDGERGAAVLSLPQAPRRRVAWA